MSPITYTNRKWRPYCCGRMPQKCLFSMKAHILLRVSCMFPLTCEWVSWFVVLIQSDYFFFSFFIATYKLETGWQYGGGRLHVFPMSTKSLWSFFWSRFLREWVFERVPLGHSFSISSGWELSGCFRAGENRSYKKKDQDGGHWRWLDSSELHAWKKSAWEKKGGRARSRRNIVVVLDEDVS